MGKKKILLETNELILYKKLGLKMPFSSRYKLIDKKDKHKFKVIEWFHCSSMGTVAGYSVWTVMGVGLDTELTPYRGNPKTINELIDFVKGINYVNL